MTEKEYIIERFQQIHEMATGSRRLNYNDIDDLLDNIGAHAKDSAEYVELFIKDN